MHNLLKKNNICAALSLKKAVFLDRDGTINEEINYLASTEQLRLIGGAAKAIRILNQSGLLTIVVTNQSGVARGMFTEDRLKLIHSTIEDMLKIENAFIDAWFYCPHHPTETIPELKEQYGISCHCRKPLTGMVEMACAAMKIDPRRSYVVGDSQRDIELAWNAGAKAVLVLTGHGEKTLNGFSSERKKSIAFVADNLYEASLWIAEQERNETE